MHSIKFSNTSFLRAILSQDKRIDLEGWLRHPDLNWMDFMAFAGNQLVTPAVAARLVSAGMRDLLPLEVLDALQIMLDSNRRRNGKLIENFYCLAADLNRQNIQPMPLKGINVLLGDLYTDIGERVTSDIDVLICPDEVQPALEVLKQQGYLQRRNPFLGNKGKDSGDYEALDPNDYRHQLSADYYHLTPIKHPVDASANFEIHIRPCRTATASGQTLNELAKVNAGVQRVNDALYRRATDTFALLHTMHHMLLQDHLYEQGINDYRHLQDCQRLLQRIESEDCGEGLLAAVENTELSAWLEFLRWQCEDKLHYKSTIALQQSAEGTRLIKNYERMRPTLYRRLLFKSKRFFFSRLPRLITGKAIQEAYGGAPLLTAAPLYTRYQYHRLRHGISQRFISRS